MKRRSVSLAALLSAPLLLLPAFSAVATNLETKLKPEELIAKHLEALGAPEARSAAKSRTFSGACTVAFHLGGVGQFQGKGRFLSEGVKTALSLEFNALDYPHERLAFDGKEVTSAQLRPGVRSILGEFVRANSAIIKEGLMGGALSTAWPLLDLETKKPRLSYSGIKKIDGRSLHEMSYTPRKGSPLRISLFFDQETFSHVRTQYRITQAAAMGASPAASADQIETRHTLVEEFSEFRTEQGLNLPHIYKLALTVEGRSRSLLWDWTLQFSKVEFNQPIDPQEFDVKNAMAKQ